MRSKYKNKRVLRGPSGAVDDIQYSSFCYFSSREVMFLSPKAEGQWYGLRIVCSGRKE